MSESSFFSIIIPVYNTEQYLKRCLDSVINQTFKDIEIIIVNDCSPKNCDEIISEYKNNNIKLIKHDRNMGLYQARITGIKNASGKYIVHLDSDDFLCNNILYHIYKVIEKKDYDIIFYDIMLTDGNKEIEFDNWFKIPIDNFNNNEDILNYFISGENHTMWGKVYKHDMIKKCLDDFPKIENITSYEDLMQNIIISKFACSTYSIHRIGYCYRKNEEGNSIKKRKDNESKNKLLKETSTVINILHNFFVKYDLYKNYYNNIALLFKSIIINYYNLSHEDNYNKLDDKSKLECLDILDNNIKKYFMYYITVNLKPIKKNNFKLFYIGFYTRIIVIYIFGINISIRRNKKYSYILNK